jgi:hypothetical protein
MHTTTQRSLNLAVGDITVNTTLSAHGDSITPASGQVIKVLFYGVTENSTNSYLTVVEVASPNGEIALATSGSGNAGTIGATLGSLSQSNTLTSAMVPLYLDDTTSLRLNGALASTGDICLVSYMRVA